MGLGAGEGGGGGILFYSRGKHVDRVATSIMYAVVFLWSISECFFYLFYMLGSLAECWCYFCSGCAVVYRPRVARAHY